VRVTEVLEAVGGRELLGRGCRTGSGTYALPVRWVDNRGRAAEA